MPSLSPAIFRKLPRDRETVVLSLAQRKVIPMESRYWIGRMRAEMTAARAASTAEARLIHYDLAGRYRLKAAVALPFLAARSLPVADAARPTLHLPDPTAASLERHAPAAGPR